MATSKIFNIGPNSDSVHKYLKNSLEYISRLDKTDGGKWIGTLNCERNEVYHNFIETKQYYNKTGKRQGYHMWVSFPGKEVPPEIAFEIIEKIARRFIGMEYEAMYTVHTDTPNIHGHIVFNSVSYLTGIKYHYANGDWAKIIQPIVNDVCGEYGLEQLKINDESFCKEHRYSGNRKVFNQMIRRDMDYLIMTCSDYEEFLIGLKKRGYEVKNAYGEGAYLTVKPPGMERWRRVKTLGEEYSEEHIRQRIMTEKISRAEKPKMTMPRLGKPARFSKYYGPRMKLNKVQKKAFARKYRIQKMRKRPYSEVWKHREEIKNFKQAQERYLYLVKNHISKREEIEDKLSRNRTAFRAANQEKRNLFRERSSFNPIFELMNKLELLQEAEEMYQAGMGFEEAHAEYWKVLSNIQKAGYEPDTLRELHQYFKEKLSDVCSRERRLKKEIQIEKEILQDMEKERNKTLERKKKEEKTR